MLRTTACTRALIATLALGCGDHIVSPAPLTLAGAPPVTVLDACPAGATRWAAAVNGNWTDAARWTAGVPTAATPACIDLPGTYVVTAATLSSLPAQQLFHGVPGATTQPVLRLTRGTLAISGDASIHGRVEINAPSGVGATLSAATVGVAATGTVTTGDNGTKAVQAQVVDNAGSIAPGAPAASVSRLTLSVVSLVNRGQLGAATGRQLLIVATPPATPAVTFASGSVDGSGLVQQTGGRLDVLGGTLSGEVDLVGVAELQLGHDGGGRFNLLRTPGTTPAVTSRLTGTVGASQHVWLGNNNITVDANSVTNRGQITIHSDAASGTVATTLRTTALWNEASGTITYFGTGGPTISGTVSNGGLITTSGGPSMMHMQLRGSLQNRGTVRVVGLSSLNALTQAGVAGPVFMNEGGTLDLAGTYTQVGGRFHQTRGTVSATGLVNFTDVEWRGEGVWQRALTLNGASAMLPGSLPTSTERVAITGDYTPSASTVTRIEIADVHEGRYDRIDVSGTARFAGALTVTATEGFVPKPCQVFPIVTYAAHTGTFSNAATPIDLGNGMRLRQVYTPTALVLVAYSTSAGVVNVAPTEVHVSMSGLTATYDVCLGAGSDVVTVLPDAHVLVNKTTLDFSTSPLPQTVTVSAAPAATQDGLIRHTAASGTPVASVHVAIAGIVLPDVEPPVTSASVSPLPDAGGVYRSDVTVTLNATDEGANASGVAQLSWSLSGAQSGSGLVNGSSATVTVTSNGESVLTYYATDAAGNVETVKMLGIRLEKRPATIACSATPNEIWPPNGELVPVSITVTHDRADGFVLNWVRMTEPGTDNMSGSVKGRTVGDMVDWVPGTADTQGLVRASRAGSGTGRVYTFEYRTVGGAAPATATCAVRVLHDRGRGQ